MDGRQPAGCPGEGPRALTAALPRVQVFAAKVLNLVLPNMSLGRIDSSVLSRNKTEVSLSEEPGAAGAGGGSWPRPRPGGSHALALLRLSATVPPRLCPVVGTWRGVRRRLASGSGGRGGRWLSELCPCVGAPDWGELRV